MWRLLLEFVDPRREEELRSLGVRLEENVLPFVLEPKVTLLSSASHARECIAGQYVELALPLVSAGESVGMPSS